jgi:hypothetical protein
LIYLGGLLLGFLLHWQLPLPLVTAVLVGPLRFLGAFCLVAGLALDIGAVATFQLAGTTPHPAGPTTTFVEVKSVLSDPDVFKAAYGTPLAGSVHRWSERQ